MFNFIESKSSVIDKVEAGPSFSTVNFASAASTVLGTQPGSVFIINQGVSCSAPIVSNDLIMCDSVVVSSSTGQRGEFLRTVASGGRPISSVLPARDLSGNSNMFNFIVRMKRIIVLVDLHIQVLQ